MFRPLIISLILRRRIVYPRPFTASKLHTILSYLCTTTRQHQASSHHTRHWSSSSPPPPDWIDLIPYTYKKQSLSSCLCWVSFRDCYFQGAASSQQQLISPLILHWNTFCWRVTVLLLFACCCCCFSPDVILQNDGWWLLWWQPAVWASSETKREATVVWYWIVFLSSLISWTPFVFSNCVSASHASSCNNLILLRILSPPSAASCLSTRWTKI